MTSSKHVLEGIAFRLRPVEMSDASIIVELRTASPLRSRFLNPIPDDVHLQRSWIARYLERDDDYYWVIECRQSGEAEGLIGLYNVDAAARTAEWGRWIVRSGSLAALESVFLLYQFAFDKLSLSSVYCCTITNNQGVVAFHDSCGLVRDSERQEFIELGDGRCAITRHTCAKEQWPIVRMRLEPQVNRLGRRMSRLL